METISIDSEQQLLQKLRVGRIFRDILVKWDRKVRELRNNPTEYRIDRGEAEQLVNQYVENRNLRKVILDPSARPTIMMAFKHYFKRLYVFPVRLTNEIMLVVSEDREYFWKLSRTAEEASMWI
ncbi:MAG: hypothetical protein ACFFBS_09665 [Promethearchaeota archaeon]